jgi:hypothetical protein
VAPTFLSAGRAGLKTGAYIKKTRPRGPVDFWPKDTGYGEKSNL